MNDAEAKRVLEALLLVSEKPLLIEQAREALGASAEIDSAVHPEPVEGERLAQGRPFEPPHLRRLLTELAEEYAQSNRGIRILEVAEGFQLVTDPKIAPFVMRLTRRVRSVRLSRPSLETLSIVAYRQPLTRVEIEQIRGVDAAGVLETLLKLNLIHVTGRKDTVGRPFVYGTTREFLDHFGLKSLSDLPSLEELKGFEGDLKPVAQTD